LAVAAVAIPAAAADLPSRAARVAPLTAPPPAYDWSGVYLGGHGGYGWGRVNWSELEALDTAVEDDTLNGQGPCYRVKGQIAGGRLGLQYHWGAVVAGLEFSGAWANLTAPSCCQYGLADDTYTSTVHSIYQVVGRLGLAGGQWHGYVKGGYAG